MKMRLNVVIVNYRTPELVIDCLASIENEIDIAQDIVVVVDNYSNDDSVEKIEEAVSKNKWNNFVKVISSPVNGGFSAGNNVGIKTVNADAYLLLNSDTIVRPGAIRSLIKAMNAHPEAGLISPRLEWLDGTPQISCFRYRSPISELICAAATGLMTKLLGAFNVPLNVSDVSIKPQWTSFACVLIRHEVIEQIGFMDEGYFMYFDDIDYCRKARNVGWEVLHWPEARVVHLRGGSSPVKAAIAARKRPKPYYYASRTRYFTTFYGPTGLWIANSFWLVGRSVSLVRELLRTKQPHTCEYEAQDIWLNWRNPMQPFLSSENKSS